MRERLFTPLGLTHTVTLPEEALLFGAAVGHVDAGERAEGRTRVGPAALGRTRRAHHAHAPRMCSPSPGCTSRGRRRRRHPRPARGRRVDGDGAYQADLPDKYLLGDSWGLGWIRFGWNGHRLIGHDGNTIGQAAFLRILPEHGLAVTLLTNGGHTRDLYEDLYREVFEELAGVEMPHPLAVPRSRSRWTRPRSWASTSALGAHGGAARATAGPRLRTTVLGPSRSSSPTRSGVPDWSPCRDELFAVRPPGAQTWIP